MNKVEIKGGGQVERLNGKLTAINVAAGNKDSTGLELWLHSIAKDDEGLGDSSLTYLSLDEALELSKMLDSAIKDSINQYTKSE
jgi:hypothetical protein